MTAPEALVDAYFAAWNAHDGAALVPLFSPEGTYEDPTTGGPLAPTALASVVGALVAAFPDLRFERSSTTAAGARVAVEWLMTGTHLGLLPTGVEATGRCIMLRGVDVFDVADGGLRRVRGHFDQKALAEALGLQVLIQPVEQGPARFGYSMRVASGNPRPPGVIALTWIEGANEDEKARIRAHSRQNVRDFVAEPGFIGIVTGFTGLRGFTVTAWEDEAAMARALSGHHAAAMDELFSERFVASVWTSVWQPTRINRIWVRCVACGALQDVTDDHRRCRTCNGELPERPAFW